MAYVLNLIDKFKKEVISCFHKMCAVIEDGNEYVATLADTPLCEHSHDKKNGCLVFKSLSVANNAIHTRVRLQLMELVVDSSEGSL